VSVSSSLAQTLGASTLSATGTVANAGVNGTLSVTLADLLREASGAVAVQAGLSSTLDALLLNGSGLGPPPPAKDRNLAGNWREAYPSIMRRVLR
jgi:hypothetical protein